MKRNPFLTIFFFFTCNLRCEGWVSSSQFVFLRQLFKVIEGRELHPYHYPRFLSQEILLLPMLPRILPCIIDCSIWFSSCSVSFLDLMMLNICLSSLIPFKIFSLVILSVNEIFRVFCVCPHLKRHVTTIYRCSKCTPFIYKECCCRFANNGLMQNCNSAEFRLQAAFCSLLLSLGRSEMKFLGFSK